MQNSGTPSGSAQGWAGTPANVADYPGHQRSDSNPRHYPTDPTIGPSRSDPTQSVYAGDHQYPAYQQQGYVQSQSYGYNNGIGLPSSFNPGGSPSQASGSRRASGPKTSTPPTGTPTSNTNPSPGYYSHQRHPSSGTHPSEQSPYQPQSAPPQAATHQHAVSSLPQTAHPYGGGYYNYYDQSHHQPPPSQWPPHYPQAGSQYAPPRQSAPRQPGLSNSATTTPTMPQTGMTADSNASSTHRTPATPQAAYEYAGTAGPVYGAWSGHDASRGHPSTWAQSSTGRSSGGVPVSPAIGHQWQGYPQHHSVPPHQIAPPHHLPPGQYPPGSYPAQQWNGQQYAYPPPHQWHGQMGGAVQGVPPGKKGKKDKKATGGEHDYMGLGKRESGTEDEADMNGKRRKGKFVEEKPIPKPPAKSHLHPPRQAQSAWQLFFTDELNKAKAAHAGQTSPGGTPHAAKLNVAQIAKDAGASYANLNEEQKVYYGKKVHESKEQYSKDLAAWQATLTPEDIRAENAFRTQQRKDGKSRKGNLKDPNAPKKPLSAYFLFLKGIREDDELRARVWAEETETTKQSVLAAERWRSLSDDEKKPFLHQAERDKQDYEAARKIYEEDAAARARGEEPPVRAVPIADEVKHEPPKPVIHDRAAQLSTEVSDLKPLLSPDMATFNQFTHDSDDSPSSDLERHITSSEPFPTTSSEPFGIEFSGFPDPLEGIDLGGFGAAAQDPHTGGEHWGEMESMMGVEEVKPELREVEETEDVSVAPALDEAMAETAEDVPSDRVLPKTEEEVQEMALQAEGHLAVPHIPESKVEEEHSGVPTEEVNEHSTELFSLPEEPLPTMINPTQDRPPSPLIKPEEEAANVMEPSIVQSHSPVAETDHLPDEAIPSEEITKPEEEMTLDAAAGEEAVENGEEMAPATEVEEQGRASEEVIQFAEGVTAAPAQATDAEATVEATDEEVIRGTQGPEETMAGDEIEMPAVDGV